MSCSVPLLGFPSLEAAEGLVHALTTRAGGVSAGRYAALNLGYSSGDDPAAVRENRARVEAALGDRPLRTARQVHGRAVARVDHASRDLGAADVLVVERPGVLGGVLGADCGLLLLVAPRHHVLALVHAGWRGVVAGAVDAAVAVLERDFRVPPDVLQACIAPCISGARYEVGAEVLEAARGVLGTDAASAIVARREGRPGLDLRAALRVQLVRTGVPPDAIETLEACTYDDSTRFFSHRRDGPATGRHMLVAGWRA